MANAHNVIVLENFLQEHMQPHSLGQRRELAEEIIHMFSSRDDMWFHRFADTFPNNPEGRKTHAIIAGLENLHEESPYIFHDYLQAVSSAEYMVATIKQLPREAFQMFTGILILRPRVKDVNAAFDLRDDNAPVTNIATYLMAPGRLPPENMHGGVVSGFARGLEKKFPHHPALKGRFYLRTILSQVPPQDAHQVCISCFMTDAATPNTAAESILSHQAMRWAAMVTDPKRRKLMDLTSIPMPPSTYSKIDTWRTRKTAVASELCNGAVILSLAFGIATGILSKNPPSSAQVQQTIQNWLKPGP